MLLSWALRCTYILSLAAVSVCYRYVIPLPPCTTTFSTDSFPYLVIYPHRAVHGHSSYPRVRYRVLTSQDARDRDQFIEGKRGRAREDSDMSTMRGDRCREAIMMDPEE